MVKCALCSVPIDSLIKLKAKDTVTLSEHTRKLSYNIFTIMYTQSCKNSTNLQTWFGGRFWPTNEEGFVASAPIPFSWESGNQLINQLTLYFRYECLKPFLFYTISCSFLVFTFLSVHFQYSLSCQVSVIPCNRCLRKHSGFYLS